MDTVCYDRICVLHSNKETIVNKKLFTVSGCTLLRIEAHQILLLIMINNIKINQYILYEIY